MTTRALIVDDHELMRRGLMQVLGEGFPEMAIAEAADAQQAVSALESGPFEVMVLDVSLPGRSGIELLDEAKQRWRQMPVVMLSVHSEEEYAVRCLRHGAAGYVTKASATHELLNAVRQALSGGHYVTAAIAERLASSVGSDLDAAPEEALSRRELEVLRLVALGRSLKEIAAQLGLSEKTIASYRARISAKLGLSTNVELTRFAMRRGLVD